MKITIKQLHELIEKNYKEKITLSTLRVWKNTNDTRLSQILKDLQITEIVNEKRGHKPIILTKK